MNVRVYIASLITVLLNNQLSQCDWTFSMRIDAGRCCSSVTCEEIGTCDDVFIGICIRKSNTAMENRTNCPYFIAGNGSDINRRELTPDDVVNLNLISRSLTHLSTIYQGGFQIYTGVLTMVDSPPYTNVIDELIIEVVTMPGGSEISVTAHGLNGRANITFSDISVQCIPGYSGNDCVTINECNEHITSCDMRLGYCSSDGDCICYDGSRVCVESTGYHCSEDITCSQCDSDSGQCNDQNTTEITDSMDTDETLGFDAGIGIGIAMIVCTIAIMGTIILALLIFCVRRKQRKAVAANEVEQRFTMTQNVMYGMNTDPTPVYDEIINN